jgi:hypothetical protein
MFLVVVCVGVRFDIALFGIVQPLRVFFLFLSNRDSPLAVNWFYCSLLSSSFLHFFVAGCLWFLVTSVFFFDLFFLKVFTSDMFHKLE